MANWLQVLIAAICALAIVVLLWKASQALTRRGVIVRPVDLMDANMTTIEERAAKVRASEPKSFLQRAIEMDNHCAREGIRTVSWRFSPEAYRELADLDDPWLTSADGEPRFMLLPFEVDAAFPGIQLLSGEFLASEREAADGRFRRTGAR